MVSPVSPTHPYFSAMPEARLSPGGASDALRTRSIYSESAYQILIEEKEKSLFTLIQEHFKPIYKSLKQDDLFKLLFMERKDHDKGKYGFDSEETNYLACMLDGYEFMLKTLDNPITPDYYRALHDICCYEVRSPDAPGGIPMGYRVMGDGAEAFRVILGSTLSEKGYAELIEKFKSATCIFEDQTYHPFKESLLDPAKTIDLTGVNTSLVKVKPIRIQTCEFNVKFAVQKYEAALKDTEENTLKAIAALCQDLDQFHVFVDGNIRTTGVLLLNKLLLSHKLTPSVLKDVNCLDCLSIEEIVGLIKEGQVFFESLIQE